MGDVICDSSINIEGSCIVKIIMESLDEMLFYDLSLFFFMFLVFYVC